MNKKERERQEAIEELRTMLKPGDEVITILRNVSRSGMSRDISPLIINGDQVRAIAWLVAKALGLRCVESNGSNAVKIGGCGMDMGFKLVYLLGRELFPDGFKLAENQYGRNGDTSGFDSDGGYALRQRWL